MRIKTAGKGCFRKMFIETLEIFVIFNRNQKIAEALASVVIFQQSSFQFIAIAPNIFEIESLPRKVMLRKMSFLIGRMLHR